jgi:type IV pilus assembly protein PilE
MLNLRLARQRGFTLIELMIALAIVGILTAFAYPSYIVYVQKGKRAEAESVMLEAVQYLQRYYVSHNGYADADLTTVGLNTSPKGSTGTAVVYNISLNVDPDNPTDTRNKLAQSYTIYADLAVDNPNDACGDLTLDHTGAKGQSKTDATTAQCWR